ncbi:hypothetical protein [Aquamicrobium terrae]|uniref:hypothetical protein n=1 Tax=Aquamicrobium terrae TaxID=1324945 RepID=UPI0033971AD4
MSADEAAQAVGVSPATLYRWVRRPEPMSRRPRWVRKRNGCRRWHEPSRKCAQTIRCGARRTRLADTPRRRRGLDIHRQAIIPGTELELSLINRISSSSSQGAASKTGSHYMA